MEQTMKDLMKEIKEVTQKARSASKVDEIRVMRTMLNDPDFTVAIYDKSKGLIGTRNPHEEAVKFVSGICSSVTGIDSKSADELASNYEFTKKDATFMLDNTRSFIQTYLETGRKLNISQTKTSQAEIFTRHIDAKEKQIPGSDKTTTVAAYDKIISKSKCPKYAK